MECDLGLDSIYIGGWIGGWVYVGEGWWVDVWDSAWVWAYGTVVEEGVDFPLGV